MKKIIVITLALGVMFIVGITGCTKDVTLTIKSDVAVSTTVSFGKDLVPLFTANCALTGCHGSGGHKPDLTAQKAYVSLQTGKYYDTTKATSSIIYERLTGVLTPAMPMGKTTNPSNINSLVLGWIKQGAKNN